MLVFSLNATAQQSFSVVNKDNFEAWQPLFVGVLIHGITSFVALQPKLTQKQLTEVNVIGHSVALSVDVLAISFAIRDRRISNRATHCYKF